MAIDLTATINEYKSLLITLRDDLSRFGNLLDGDHLTTVMGPAAKAGVKESTEYLAEVKDNALLGTMTQAHGNQEAIQHLVAELMRGSAGKAAKRAVATAKIAVSQGVIATMDNIAAQAGATVTKIEATAKLLLAGAEAKANVITRKRQQAEDRFVKSVALVSEKVKLVNNLDKRLEEMSNDLNKTSADATIPTGEMYKQIGQIS
jgi:phosphopantothenate synthetase